MLFDSCSVPAHVRNIHCVKSVRIRSFSGPYSVRMREYTDQKNSEYEHFSRSDAVRLYILDIVYIFLELDGKCNFIQRFS